MNRLFNTRKVIWENSRYVEIEDDVKDDVDDVTDEEEDGIDYDVGGY